MIQVRTSTKRLPKRHLFSKTSLFRSDMGPPSWWGGRITLLHLGKAEPVHRALQETEYNRKAVPWQAQNHAKISPCPAFS